MKLRRRSHARHRRHRVRPRVERRRLLGPRRSIGVVDAADQRRPVEPSHALLQQQIALNIEALQAATGRGFTETERQEISATTLHAWRWTFLVAGLEHPNVVKLVDEITQEIRKNQEKLLQQLTQDVEKSRKDAITLADSSRNEVSKELTVTKGMVAEDMQSLNGLYSEHGAHRVAKLSLARQPGFRIGRTTLRVRDARHPVPAEKLLVTKVVVFACVVSGGVHAGLVPVHVRRSRASGRRL